ncbi:SIR2 family protein [Flavivirga aquimarina]|uniref:SIR2 family protein n=1 Tax=Flavivirga aquimarina TaxID=2027862 RepID=A0ABT8WD37_9FLAO|nr:SIR2 family protein [Flavivirga aquimarina]MDO5971043.1 SIR2 family protein [Flavivirga aquimarina]
MLNEFEWTAIIEGIKTKQCIICLGPELFLLGNSFEDQKTPNVFSDYISNYLLKHKDELNIKVQENGWFHLNHGGSDGPTYQAIKGFYNRVTNSTSKGLLDKIAQIKFHLYLSLTPDYHLTDSFEELGLSYVFDSYVRNQPEKINANPTIERPLIYNLLGELNNRNSLVLTYDDFYDYLESVIKGNSMSKLIKDNLLDAQYYLFIGMSFNQWFVHLFMRILRQHKERKTKYATGMNLSPKDIDICKEQYHIRFVNSDIPEFIDQLFARCKQHNLIKDLNEKQQRATARSSLVSYLLNLAQKNNFDKIDEKLKESLNGKGETRKPLLLKVIHLKGQYNNFKDKKLCSLIRPEEEPIQLNIIRDSYIQLINEFKNELIV